MAELSRLRELRDVLAGDHPGWAYAGPGHQQLRIDTLTEAVVGLLDVFGPPVPASAPGGTDVEVPAGPIEGFPSDVEPDAVPGYGPVPLVSPPDAGAGAAESEHA